MPWEILIIIIIVPILGELSDYLGMNQFILVFLIIGVVWLILYFLVSILRKWKQEENLEKPLINKEYGRCIDCMSPDISLVKKENVIVGYDHEKLDGTKDNRYKNNQAFYKTVLYYKCNDCSLEFTNYEREREERERDL